MAIISVTSGKMEYLAAEGIAAPHCFTTRRGGVSTGYLDSLNLGIHRGDEACNVAQNFRILAHAVGVEPAQLVVTRQIHSDIVRQVDKADWGKHILDGASPECDALITNTPGTALVVFTADCTPILLHDPVTGAVGAVHAGWRGTAAGIAEKTVLAMVSAFGCRPGDIRAAIGPNISQCCFQTDGDVPEAMVAALGDEAKPFIRQSGQKYYVNLKEINARFLRRAGVEKIEIAPHCTACQPELFWSHRITGGRRGSQGAVIVCKEGAK